MLKEREGYFSGLSSFTGVAEIVYGFNTGLFKVKAKKETLTFTYERDFLILGDEDFHVRRVTVYYDGIERYGGYTALKMVVTPKGSVEARRVFGLRWHREIGISC